MSFTYDALSRNLTQVGPQGTATSQWDIGGRRTKLTYPDGFYLDYDYGDRGLLWHIRENGAASGPGVLATYAYGQLNHLDSITYGNGAVTSYTYTGPELVATMTHDFPGTANDQTATFIYNPAQQIVGVTRSNDAYAWTGHYNENKTGVANGLNQLTSVGPKTLTHDARGNVTAFGTKAFTYSSEDLLVTGPGSTLLYYDPAMRLRQVTSGATVKLGYDGLDRIAEYDAGNVVQRRYVFGPGMDQPLAWYEGSGTTDRRFLGADERGSIIAVTDRAGGMLGINKYDEYGQPQATNLGTFGYTGQAWLPSIGEWYYKAREYDPELGRFLQTDPIGYEGGINLYAYVENDPVNLIDPLGLILCRPDQVPVFVRSSKRPPDPKGPDDPVIAPGRYQCISVQQAGLTPARKVHVALAARHSPPARRRPSCPTTNTTLGVIAREAGEFSDATAGIGVVSGVLAVATSETIVGGVTLGAISAGSFALSAISAAVQIGAEALDRNTHAANSHGLGTAVSAGASGVLSATAGNMGGPATRLGAKVYGEIAGRTTASLACGVGH
jgi:RHS repeat-associated protein